MICNFTRSNNSPIRFTKRLSLNDISRWECCASALVKLIEHVNMLMNPLFTIELPDEFKPRLNIRKRRHKSEQYRLCYTESKLLRSSRLNLFRQFYSGLLFHSEHMTATVKRQLGINMEIRQQSIVLTYVLEGSLSIKVPGALEKISVPAGQSFAQSLPAGKYVWTLQPGKLKVICLVIHPQWIFHMNSVFTELAPINKELIDDNDSYQSFRSYKMSPHTRKYLKKLLHCRSNNKLDLEEALFSSINKLAIEYNKQLVETGSKLKRPSKQIAYEVRDRIIEVVANETIPRVNDISEFFHVSPKALRRYCIKTFKMNVQELILDAQMKAAFNLIRRGLLIKDVAIKLGYSELANFSKRYRLYFGYPPGSIRSAKRTVISDFNKV